MLCWNSLLAWTSILDVKCNSTAVTQSIQKIMFRLIYLVFIHFVVDVLHFVIHIHRNAINQPGFNANIFFRVINNANSLISRCALLMDSTSQFCHRNKKHTFVRPSVRLFVCRSVLPSPSVLPQYFVACLCVNRSVRPSVCLSVCLSVQGTT